MVRETSLRELAAGMPSDDGASATLSPLEDAHRLLIAFAKIRNADVRRAIVILAQAMAAKSRAP